MLPPAVATQGLAPELLSVPSKRGFSLVSFKLMCFHSQEPMKFFASSVSLQRLGTFPFLSVIFTWRISRQLLGSLSQPFQHLRELRGP